MPKTESFCSRSAGAGIGFLLLALILLSCTPLGSVSPEDSDAVVTSYDLNFDFGAARTYSVADTIVHITSGEAPGPSRRYDHEIIQQVADNMDNRGYRRILNPAPDDSMPDIVMLVAATGVQNFDTGGSIQWMGYWGWYPVWPEGAGGDNDWFYPGFFATYSFTTGTLLIQLVDPAMANPLNRRVPMHWIGGINGMLADNDARIAARFASGINQCFTQSPYLRSRQP